MKNTLVSVNIPTWNSEKNLAKTLESIKRQSYKNIEVIIIDSNSKDSTKSIAKKYGCKIIDYPGILLGARYMGIKRSRGKFVLLLDSDQILEPDVIERAVNMMDKYDMLVLEEFTYKPKTFIQKLYEADRRLVHQIKDLDPYTSVLLPRFYKKSVLIKAFENIPKELLPNLGGPDHALIYFETYKISQKIEILPRSVYHIEPATIKELIKKNYRWGKTSCDMEKVQHYKNFWRKKIRFRKGVFSFGLFKYKIFSITLLILKGIPYKMGLFIARNNKHKSKGGNV